MNNWSKLSPHISLTRLMRVRTIQRPYSDWLGIWWGIVEIRSSQFILVKENWQTISAPFFTNKILNIRSNLGLTDTHTGGSVTNCFSGIPLNTFMDATEAEIWNIIKQSPVKSCELDPLPTWLLKECKAELVPLITDIVNMSLRESMIPKSLKTAHIRPL